jgi:hypothetical protein
MNNKIGLNMFKTKDKPENQDLNSKANQKISQIRENYSHQKIIVEQNGKGHSLVKLVAAKEESR